MRLAYVFLGAAAVYLAICGLMYFNQRRLTYFPDSRRVTPAQLGLSGVSEITLPTPDGETLVAWYAKAKPGELFYGTPGLGSTAHVSTELFKSMTGVEMTHVPYKGSAPALTDLIAGRVHLMIDNLPAAQAFAESGAIRPLAVSSIRRWPGLPDLPTIAEAGVPGYEAASWFTIGAPARTSQEIIAKLNASIDRFLKTEDGIARLRKLGAEPAGGSPEDMQAYVLAEIGKWGKVAKFAGIKPE